jgi:arsenate reductase (glutaredoxin)
MSGLPLPKFFNTSGIPYRRLGLKEKLPRLAADEQFALLSGDGMLVKRPLLIGNGLVLVGFKEAEWREALQR